MQQPPTRSLHQSLRRCAQALDASQEERSRSVSWSKWIDSAEREDGRGSDPGQDGISECGGLQVLMHAQRTRPALATRRPGFERSRSRRGNRQRGNSSLARSPTPPGLAGSCSLHSRDKIQSLKSYHGNSPTVRARLGRKAQVSRSTRATGRWRNDGTTGAWPRVDFEQGAQSNLGAPPGRVRETGPTA